MIRELVSDALILSGCGVAVWGVWQMYGPWAYVLGGCLLVPFGALVGWRR